MTIFIGGAWPYANGSLHLGRVASLLPGDILARYFRQKGEKVLYVSGSDCHGTPISIRAGQEGVEPSTITDRFHEEFTECFRKLGFSYDLYTRTDHPFHHKVVQELFLKLLERGYLYKQAVEQTYCPGCDQFLPDRYVEGLCPHCGSQARGDQCDACSALLDPLELREPKCKLCKQSPDVKHTDHYFLALSKLQEQLQAYVKQSTGWRDNAVQLTMRYLEEGLHDRAATRDLAWGIDVPLEGFEGKKIYVWIEAVSGYLSASMQWAAETNSDWEPFWSEQATAYYVHGKDNVPFHSLILPAILLGTGPLHLPDRILSSEYLTLEGRKFSTSRNWAVWLPYMLERYQPDSLRYFLTVNGPEQRDTDFSWNAFIHSHNGELLGAFGNFVHRNLMFLMKSFHGEVPDGQMDETVRVRLEALYTQTGALLEAGKCKAALENLFAFVRSANKYFDEQRPWLQVKEAPAAGANTLYTCVQIIANLSSLLAPFLPFSCSSIRSFLAIKEPSWSYFEAPSGTRLQSPEALFERIETSRIDEEMEQLQSGRLPDA
ncbi:methionine--tRNA ligase [Paenibacillus sp. OAS669]|uniref:methionine--tRNA ligase n=1 Tax=Paenibacillus sp. OAS669 TaxID=2663821 RepID=UPI00178A1972|nr:methionine--tRNA ligase [Paenibacillus sp. OAS669]MBE1445719.1 methionyl-tRNA synthetase [Paenibacillus sp. OAS669]